MHLIYSEIDLLLTWSANCVITGAGTFVITEQNFLFL